MDRRIVEYLSMGTGKIMDPIRPRKFNTFKAKVGNAAASFDKIIKKYPEGFSIDKKFFLSYLGVESISRYVHGLFRQYGYSVRVLKKKPYIMVKKHEDTRNK